MQLGAFLLVHMHHLFKSTLECLDAWAARDETPQRSKRLTLDRDGSMKLDENGNPHKSHDDYGRRVTRPVKRLEREGWLLPADARAVREEAASSDIP